MTSPSRVRAAILDLPEAAWRPAIRQDGEPREGAWVAELTERAGPRRAGPTGTRVIVRRERPHPGAQLSFTDHDGHRFLATLTDLAGDPVELECLHRARANAEDRVRAGQADRPGEPAVPRLRPQRRLARALADRPRPDRLDPTARARRRARRLRTQDAALPAAAHRRPAGLPRPPRDPAPATQLALGRRPRRRLRPPGRAATTRALTDAARPTTTITDRHAGHHRPLRSRPDARDRRPATAPRQAPPHGQTSTERQPHSPKPAQRPAPLTHHRASCTIRASGHPTAARPQQPVYLQGIDTPTSSKPCMPDERRWFRFTSRLAADSRESAHRA